MGNFRTFIVVSIAVVHLALAGVADCAVVSSANVPLDSPIYTYLEKLSGMGLLESDIWGVRPFSKAEAARLALEAEEHLHRLDGGAAVMAGEFVKRLKEMLPREVRLRTTQDEPALFDADPLASARLRYVYLDGVPRSYNRPVHDPGGDGVFGIGAGLRPDNPYPSLAQQRGGEGTPLLEGNEGIRYRRGNNGQFQFAAEGYVSRYVTALLEPLVLVEKGSGMFLLNKGYVKLGGGGIELEVGRDADWIGPGNRTAITLSNNARNLNQVKLSSPEPIRLKYVGDLKYTLIVSHLDCAVTDGKERQPWFYAVKLAVKPVETLEIGLNIGRQQGGPGVDNSLHEWVNGLLGGTGSDNSNSVAGIDLRWRLPWLRNTIVYGEFSGEDTASIWPIVESYVAGVYVPNLTADGRNEARFEYFFGNAILSTNGTFPEGYMDRGLNLGPFEGGASQQFFLRYTHYFAPRSTLSLDYLHSERGNLGRVNVNSQGNFDPSGTRQAVERANAGRVLVNLPVARDLDLNLMYGVERIDNFNLVGGDNRTNQLVKVDLSFRY